MRSKSKPAQTDLFGGPVVNSPDPFARVSGRDNRDLKLLALDIATKTGWCTNTASGVWDFTPKKDQSRGLRLFHFRARLTEVCEKYAIKLISFETPAIYGKHPNFVGVEMMGVLKLFCEDKGIDHKGYAPTVIQKFATGKGKGNKELMIETCKQKYGIDPKDDNEADSIHLYHLSINDLVL